MKRRLLSIVLVFAMLVSVGMPTAAATSAEQKLNDMGLLLGISEAELSATLTRDVGLTMILKSLGYTQGDADTAVSYGYFDDVTGWAKGWAELAYREGITTGVGGHLFDPSGTLTERQFVAFQLRALGYETATAYKDAVTLGKSSGLISASNNLTREVYTKRQAADVMYNALTATLQKESIKLIDKLVDKKVVAESKAANYGLIDITFKVSEVSAGNLKSMTLKFSQSIDVDSFSGDTVKVEVNDRKLDYDATYSTGIAPYQYALKLVDAHTMDIVFGLPNRQNDVVSLTINGAKAMGGAKINSFSRDIKLKDITEPKIVDVSSPNPLTIEVTYSEPVQFSVGSKLYTTVYLDGLRLAATGTMSKDHKVVNFKLPKQMTPGNHELRVEPTVDFAELSSKTQIFDFTVTADNSEPYVKEANILNREEIRIKFNEPIQRNKGYIEVEGQKYNLSNATAVAYEDNQTIKVKLEKPLPASAAFNTTTGYFEDIEDIVGNDVNSRRAFELEVLAVDKEVPAISVSVDGGNNVVVTFSEPVEEFTNIHYVLADKDDKVVPSVVRKTGTSRMVYTISLPNAQIDGVTHTLIIKGVKDISLIQNIVREFETKVTFRDLKQPEVSGIKYIGDNTARVLFTEEMDSSFIGSGDYFTYEDVSEGVTKKVSSINDYTISVSDNDKYVDIKIPGLVQSDKIGVLEVKDKSGRVIKGSTTTQSLSTPTEFSVGSMTAELVEGDTIKLTAAGHEFEYVFADDFGLRTTGGVSKYHYVRSANISDKKDEKHIVYLKLSTPIDTNAKYKGEKQFLYTIEKPQTVDTFNQRLKINYGAPLAITDAVAPKVSISNETTTITLSFSEVVQAVSDSGVYGDIVIKDKNGFIVTVDGSNLEYSGGAANYSAFDKIKIKGLTANDIYTLEVISRNIQDEAGNAIESVNATTIIMKK